jgi:hypothetical protein
MDVHLTSSTIGRNEDHHQEGIQGNKDSLRYRYSVKCYTADPENSSMSKHLWSVEPAFQEQTLYFNQFGPLIITFWTVDRNEYAFLGAQTDAERMFLDDQLTRNKAEELDLVENPYGRGEDQLVEISSPTHSSISSPLGPAKVSSDNAAADCVVRVFQRLLTKLWVACQDTSSTPRPRDGADDRSKGQHSSQKRSKSECSNEQSSKPGKKRRRQLPGNPGSECDDDDDDPDIPEGRRARGRGHRQRSEFGCPFFKHDPDRHGGRGGCRDYSNENVSKLLKVSDV